MHVTHRSMYGKTGAAGMLARSKQCKKIELVASAAKKLAQRGISIPNEWSLLLAGNPESFIANKITGKDVWLDELPRRPVDDVMVDIVSRNIKERSALTGIFRDPINKRVVATDARMLLAVPDLSIDKEQVVATKYSKGFKVGEPLNMTYPPWKMLIPDKAGLEHKQLNIEKTRRILHELAAYGVDGHEQPLLLAGIPGSKVNMFNSRLLLAGVESLLSLGAKEVHVYYKRVQTGTFFEPLTMESKRIIFIVMPTYNSGFEYVRTNIHFK